MLHAPQSSWARLGAASAHPIRQSGSAPLQILAEMLLSLQVRRISQSP